MWCEFRARREIIASSSPNFWCSATFEPDESITTNKAGGRAHLGRRVHSVSHFREFASLLKNFWRITNGDVDSDKGSELGDVAQSRGRAAQRLRESGSGLNDDVYI